MSVTLRLKLRNSVHAPVFILSAEGLKNIVSLGPVDGPKVLWEQILGLLSSGNSRIHDKRWLEEFINVPMREGRPLTEYAPWITLAARVAEIDETQECDFNLSDKEVRMLWERMRSKETQISGINVIFAMFINDFEKATGEKLVNELLEGN